MLTISRNQTHHLHHLSISAKRKNGGSKRHWSKQGWKLSSKRLLTKRDKDSRTSVLPDKQRRIGSSERLKGKLNWRGCVVNSFILRSKREKDKNKKKKKLKKDKGNKSCCSNKSKREKRPRGKGERRKKQRQDGRPKKGHVSRHREERNRKNMLNC
jgi:hypothetical protein